MMNEYDRIYERMTEWKARAEAAENKLANAEAEIEELRSSIQDLNAIRNSFNTRWDRVAGKEALMDAEHMAAFLVTGSHNAS